MMLNTFNKYRRSVLVVATISSISSALLVACGGVSGHSEIESEKTNSSYEIINFRACIISKEDAEAIVRKFPQNKERYEEYFSKFEFSKKRECYAQHWAMPAQLKGMSTHGKSGREYVRISFPSGKNRHGYIEGLEGKMVIARPIAPSLTFADSNKFRKKGYPEKTGQMFDKYEVWAYKKGSVNQALIDKEGSDLYAFITLKDAKNIVSSSNSNWIAIKSNLDDKYELSYVLLPSQLNQVEYFNELIKAQIRTYLKNKGEH